MTLIDRVSDVRSLIPPGEEGLRDALEELAVAEEELRQQNDELIRTRGDAEFERQRYEQLFDAAPEPFVVTDAYGKIGEINAAACDLFGSAPERLRGKPLLSSVALRDRRAVRTAIAEAMHQGIVRGHVFHMLRRGASEREVQMTLSYQRDAARPALFWMLHDLSEQAAYARRVADLNTELDERVRERTRQLERASAVKDDFLAMMSHELRTPITTIFGNAEILRRRGHELNDDVRDAALGDIYSEAGRLERIVDDLLLLVRSQSVAIDLEPVHAQHVLESVIRDHRRRSARTIDVNIHGEIPAVSAERTYLEQILRNLLSNAEKYSPADCSIEVSINRRGPRVLFVVADRGGGVAPDELKRVFAPFFRSPTTEKDAPGVGIGLSVCKRLVEAQGGHIWVRPRDGGGSEFGFSLAVAREWLPPS